MRGFVAFTCLVAGLVAPPACLLLMPTLFKAGVGIALAWCVLTTLSTALTGMDIRRLVADGSSAGRTLVRGRVLPFGVLTFLAGATMLARVGHLLSWDWQRALDDGEVSVYVSLIPFAYLWLGGYCVLLAVRRLVR